MKTKLLSLFCLLAFGLSTLVLSPIAHASVSAGLGVRVDLSGSGTLGTQTWVPVVTSTVKGVKGISIFSSATVPIELGVALASDSTGSEVRQMVIPAAQTLVGSPGAVFYPLSLGYGVRVSIREIGTSGALVNAGELDMNLLYN